MVVKSKTMLQIEDWTLKLIQNRDTGEEHYVLKKELGLDDSIAIPFDEVVASGGLLTLKRQGSHSATFSGALTGKNKYHQDSVIPEDLVQELRMIGPW